MPQMNPSPWLTLFIFFILSLYTINSINYFLFNFSNQTKKTFKKNVKKNNWEW